MKKQLVRATLVLEVPVGDDGSVLKATNDLNDMLDKCREVASLSGKIELVKVSETGKQSRTKLGDVA